MNQAISGLGRKVDAELALTSNSPQLPKVILPPLDGELEEASEDAVENPLDSNCEDIRLNLLSGGLDWLNLTVGPAGYGKSQFSYFELCKRVNPDLFGVRHVGFDIPDFFRIIASVDSPCTPVMADEGGEILFSLDAMDRESKKVVKFLMRARQKNMFMCVNITDFEYMNKYVRNSRGKTLVKMNAHFNRSTRLLNRGFYEFYTRRRLKAIKIDNKGLLKWPTPLFSGRAPDHGGTREWAEYQKKKDAFLDEKGGEYAKTRSYKEENVALRARLFELEKKKQLTAVIEELPDLTEELERSFDHFQKPKDGGALPWET